MLAFIIFATSIFAGASIIIYSWINGISPMPSSRKAKKCLLCNLPKDLDGNIIELGSGFGTLLFPLAKRLPNCKIIAYENSPVPYIFSCLRKFFTNANNVEIHRKNFYKEPLESASLVVCYLFPAAMERLEGKFKRELQKEAIVMSNSFALTSWRPFSIHNAGDIFNTKIYTYRVE